MTGPVLITGGAGSVGRRLAERFVSASKPVRLFDLPMMDFSAVEGRSGIEVVRGDITDGQDVASSLDGVNAVVHLAALLPPNSEQDRARTHVVNVAGTENVVRAMEESNRDATLVFTSSVSTYGDTTGDPPPVRVEHSQSAIDIYADSKIRAERVVRSSALRTVVLRIAGIAVPAFLEPPEQWPFTPEQRVEMVHRDDVVDALYASVEEADAAGKVFNVAGGPTWRLKGSDYVADFFGFLGAPAEDAVYRETPGWVDWYDTDESQRTLLYQSRSYQHYSNEMQELVEALMAG